MTDAAFLQVFQAQSALVRELAVACATDRANPSYASSIEKAVQDVVRMHAACRELYQRAWNWIAANSLEDEEATGTVLKGILDSNVQSLQSMADCAGVLAAFSYEHRAEMLREALQEAKAMAEELSRDWPWTDHAAIKESLAAHERGEWDDAEVVFGGTQGQNTSDNPR